MKKRILMVVLASCLQAMMASAQTTGRIVGTVSTADEGVIETVSNPGGAVVIIDNLTKQESIVIASDDDTLVVSQLIFGTHIVKNQ